MDSVKSLISLIHVHYEEPVKRGQIQENEEVGPLLTFRSLKQACALGCGLSLQV